MDVLQTPFSSHSAALPCLTAALRNRGYRFIAVTPATHSLVNARPENLLARCMKDVFGWSRPFTDTSLDPELFDLARRAGAVEPIMIGTRECWKSPVRAATLDRQIFLHSAFPTDAPDTVFFGPDTYRFIDAVKLALAGRDRPINNAADIGCGSGAAGIMVALASPDANVVLSDINDAALAASRINAEAAGAGNTTCLRSDVFENLPGPFDVIVANPPYLIDPALRTYRHGGGRLGERLSLRILQGALPRLAPGGQVILYTGSVIVDGQDLLRQEAEAMLADTGWPRTYREVDPDVFGEELGVGAYANADRIAAVVLTVERPA